MRPDIPNGQGIVLRRNPIAADSIFVRTADLCRCAYQLSDRDDAWTAAAGAVSDVDRTRCAGRRQSPQRIDQNAGVGKGSGNRVEVRDALRGRNDQWITRLVAVGMIPLPRAEQKQLVPDQRTTGGKSERVLYQPRHRR